MSHIFFAQFWNQWFLPWVSVTLYCKNCRSCSLLLECSVAHFSQASWNWLLKLWGGTLFLLNPFWCKSSLFPWWVRILFFSKANIQASKSWLHNDLQFWTLTKEWDCPKLKSYLIPVFIKIREVLLVIQPVCNLFFTYRALRQTVWSHQFYWHPGYTSII